MKTDKIDNVTTYNKINKLHCVQAILNGLIDVSKVNLVTRLRDFTYFTWLRGVSELIDSKGSRFRTAELALAALYILCATA